MNKTISLLKLIVLGCSLYVSPAMAAGAMQVCKVNGQQVKQPTDGKCPEGCVVLPANDPRNKKGMPLCIAR